MTIRSAKPAEHGGEFARYLDQSGRLTALCEDGIVLARSIGAPSWRIVRRKKPDFPLSEWKQRKLDRLAELPRWRREVRCLPTVRQLEEWVYDSVCESVSGDMVEPDGTGPDGAPSWLMALGLV